MGKIVEFRPKPISFRDDAIELCKSHILNNYEFPETMSNEELQEILDESWPAAIDDVREFLFNLLTAIEEIDDEYEDE